MRKIIFFLMAVISMQPFVFAQSDTSVINENEARRIISFLAADSLKGRGNGSKELLKAGLFIGDEFKKAGLQVLRGYPGYYFPFRPFGGSNVIVSDELKWNGKKLLPDQFIFLHPEPGNYSPKKLSDFKVIKIDSFFTADILLQYKNINTDLLLWSNQPQPDKENYFPAKFNMPDSGLTKNVLMVCANKAPDSIVLSGLNSYYANVEYNVVGMLRGKSRPKEIVMFSAHYDHEGVFRRGKRKDSIMNGANDNASGTTALILLAKYFAEQNNERTLLFCAFAGEELGMTGSKDFANIIPASAIVAGINIEMIGVPRYGKNGIFITGVDSSDLPSILTKQFSLTPVKVKVGPSEEEKQLFKRSDNYSFVQKGVPSHTIMSSDDDDPCYHQPCDELKRINIPHLTTIVKAIAVATQTLISGKDTPARIK